MNALQSFIEKSASFAASTALAIGLNACGDVGENGKNFIGVTAAYSQDISRRVENGMGYADTSQDSGNRSKDSRDAGDSSSGTDSFQAPETVVIYEVVDAGPSGDVAIVSADVSPEDATKDAAENTDTPPIEVSVTIDTDATSVIDSINPQDSSNDAQNSDTNLPADATISTAKGGMCADTITNECLKKFQKAMCIDPCAITNKQIKNEMQIQINTILGEFDTLIKSLKKTPKSSIVIGKSYEIIDGDITWDLTIKNAGPFNIGYVLTKNSNGGFLQLLWYVTESTLLPESIYVRDSTNKPCISDQYKIVESKDKGFSTKVTMDSGVQIMDVLEASNQCKPLEMDKLEIKYATCSTDKKNIYTDDYCSIVKKENYANSTIENYYNFSTTWNQGNYDSAADEDKAFIAKTFAQLQAMLKKYNMDVTN